MGGVSNGASGRSRAEGSRTEVTTRRGASRADHGSPIAGDVRAARETHADGIREVHWRGGAGTTTVVWDHIALPRFLTTHGSTK